MDPLRAVIEATVEKWCVEANTLRRMGPVDTPLSYRHWGTLGECAKELHDALAAHDVASVDPQKERE